jgi:PHD/YefM family antitoxin component YafN of YafNO toxin-antitoxin module
MGEPKRFVTDERGQRISVLLDVDEYRKLMEDIEELESIRAYDAARASGSAAVPLEQAIEEIDRSWKRAIQSISCTGHRKN